MHWVGMQDTYPQHPTGYVCILCGGIAVMDADGTYLCAPDAISFLGAEIESECGVLVRSTRVADIHSNSPLIRCASEFRHRNVVPPPHH